MTRAWAESVGVPGWVVSMDSSELGTRVQKKHREARAIGASHRAKHTNGS